MLNITHIFDMYQLGSDLDFLDFYKGVQTFMDLNSIAKTLEKELIDDKKIKENADTGIVRTLISNFGNALKNVDSSGLIVRTEGDIWALGNSPQVFADGGGIMTTNYGIRAVFWDNNAHFEGHYAWDLGTRGDKRLVAAMDGTLSLDFTNAGGLKIVNTDGNQSISYGHASNASIMDYISVFSSIGVSINANGSLNGISQNMIIGTMGNTGSYTTGAHVHLVYTVGGIVKNPAEYFYNNGNRSAFPMTDAARFTSGFDNIYHFNYLVLSRAQKNGLDNFLRSNYNSRIAQNKISRFWSLSSISFY